MTEIVGVQAKLPSDAALQDAIGRLTLLGFDRADLSVPTAGAGAAAAEDPAAMPHTETDARQARTLATSMAGTVGAVAAAGLTIATGGAAAVAAGAALAAGAGAAGAANLGGTAVNQTGTDQREDAAARGDLILMVRTRSQDKIDAAEAALRDAGGVDVARVADAAAGSAPQGIDSSAWTG